MVLITTLTYLPASQLVHTVEEEEDEYLPASQSAHVEAPTALENLPAVQLMQAEAPVEEYFPAVQLEQNDEERDNPALMLNTPDPSQFSFHVSTIVDGSVAILST